MVPRTPTLLTKLTAVSPAEMKLPVGSARDILPRLRKNGSIMKTFTGIIHLRPAVVSRFEEVYDETIMIPNSPVHKNFVDKLVRDLTILHDDENVVNVRVTNIEFARPMLQRIASKARNRRTKFFKASTTLLNSETVFSKSLFHKLMRYIPPEYSRRYGHQMRQQENAVVPETFIGTVFD